jgi:hypothetical protein
MECGRVLTFTSQQDFRDTITRVIKPVGLNPDLEGAVVQAIDDGCFEGNGFEAAIGHWVVRNSDLELFKPVATAIGASVTAWLPGGVAVGAVVGLAVDLLDAARKAHARGAIVTDPIDLLVLSSLRGFGGGATATELTARMNAALPGHGAAVSVWGVAEVLAALGRLQQANTPSGFVALAEPDARGNWHARA